VKGTEQTGDGKSEDSKGKGVLEDKKNVVAAGKNKIVPDPSLEQKNAEECNLVLIKQIKESRGPRLKGEDEVLFSGGEWTGRMAEELGLVDGCRTLESWLEERYAGKVRLLFVAPEEGSGTRGPGDQQLVVLQQQLQAMQQQQQLQKSQQQLQHGQLKVTEQQLHVMQQHLQMSQQQQQHEYQLEEQEEQEEHAVQVLEEEEEVTQEEQEQQTKPVGGASVA
jgi:ClpP class serine protease